VGSSAASFFFVWGDLADWDTGIGCPPIIDKSESKSGYRKRAQWGIAIGGISGTVALDPTAGKKRSKKKRMREIGKPGNKRKETEQGDFELYTSRASVTTPQLSS